MIDMALLSVIRRWHFRDGMPTREIEQRTGLSRNSIRKYLRAGTVEPKFKVPDHPSKLDPFAEKATVWLRAEAGKSCKQRRTAKQLGASKNSPFYRLRDSLPEGLFREDWMRGQAGFWDVDERYALLSEAGETIFVTGVMARYARSALKRRG